MYIFRYVYFNIPTKELNKQTIVETVNERSRDTY